MANLQAAVKASSSETTPPGTLCEGVNRLIARNIKPGEFITFFYALVDGSTGTLDAATAFCGGDFHDDVTVVAVSSSAT
jgi:Stage II sporulation protein E (SpoIIE)